MTFRLVLGIDPGNSGAIAVLADLAPHAFYDMPTREREKGGGNMVDGRLLAAKLRGVILQHRGAHVVAVIERVQAIGGKGQGDNAQSPRGTPTTNFRMGQADGIVRGVLAGLGVDVIEVEPQEWKRYFGLVKKKGEKTSKTDQKEASRQYALTMYPDVGFALARKKDHGRAEAALIALWAYLNEAFSEVA